MVKSVRVGRAVVGTRSPEVPIEPADRFGLPVPVHAVPCPAPLRAEP